MLSVITSIVIDVTLNVGWWLTKQITTTIINTLTSTWLPATAH